MLHVGLDGQLLDELEIPDYALDKHTRRGARMGRDHDHFLEVGAELAGETLDDPYADEARDARTHGTPRKTLVRTRARRSADTGADTGLAEPLWN